MNQILEIIFYADSSYFFAFHKNLMLPIKPYCTVELEARNVIFTCISYARGEREDK